VAASGASLEAGATGTNFHAVGCNGPATTLAEHSPARERAVTVRTRVNCTVVMPWQEKLMITQAGIFP
jgi:hypothetical protein